MTITVLKPMRIGDHGQADAGIAGGAFDDGAAGPQARRAAIASWMMNRAARSLTDWPGLRNSALPRISQPVASEARLQADQRRVADGGDDVFLDRRCRGNLASRNLDAGRYRFKALKAFRARVAALGQIHNRARGNRRAAAAPPRGCGYICPARLFSSGTKRRT